jgi:hypothetical protein
MQIIISDFILEEKHLDLGYNFNELEKICLKECFDSGVAYENLPSASKESLNIIEEHCNINFVFGFTKRSNKLVLLGIKDTDNVLIYLHNKIDVNKLSKQIAISQNGKLNYEHNIKIF